MANYRDELKVGKDDFKKGKDIWNGSNILMGIWVVVLTFLPVIVYGMTPTVPFIIAILNTIFMGWIFYTDEPNNKFRWITAIVAGVLFAWMMGVGSEWKVNPF